MEYIPPEAVENAATKVLAAIWPMVVISTIFFALRIYCRVTRSGQTWWDDYILGLGWLLLLTAAAVLTEAMLLGHLTHHEKDPLKVGVLVRTTHTCHLLSLALTKASFAVTLLRFSSKIQKYIIWFIIASIGFLFIFHVFAQWKKVCGDISPYVLPGQCWDVKNPGIINIVSSLGNVAYSALTDFVLAFLPWRVIWGLHMNRAEKISVSVAMSFGVIAGVTGIMKAVQSVTTMNPLDKKFLHNILLFWVFSLAEPSSTIIAASVPVLRVLIRDASRSTNYAGSSPGPNGYLKSTNSKFHVHSQAATRRTAVHPSEAALDDADSDRSILGNDHQKFPTGIAMTTEISVEFEDGGGQQQKGNDSYEMQPPRLTRRTSVLGGDAGRSVSRQV
ncbi:conserved hypothetical protein [Verticillium alfalfae VaMs.102]|uniref:Rhodopsin domain-containing protein n=1 Tax=Verticillium alfalfae (strain VaMs.102 / ATCC MYA-4576 / FGSC 10136) TaxID=526221 RepID=C9SCQ3_VERA1|nr:conserved hypothetical protein [Verticillium alfalfae VaMs.102]EEY16868.1 conserved hypothetical protein [Verticillium alfalfae VaMs.102]